MHFSRRASQMRFRGILVVHIIVLTLVCVSCGCLYLSLPIYYMFLYHIQDRYAVYVWYYSSCFLHIYIYTHMYIPVLYMCAACFFKAHIYIYRCTCIYIYKWIYIYIHVSNLFLYSAQHKCIFMHLRIRTLRFSASELVFRDANEVSKCWRGLPWKVDGGHRRRTLDVGWITGWFDQRCLF